MMIIRDDYEDFICYRNNNKYNDISNFFLGNINKFLLKILNLFIS